jgi:BMFP domain-containing protein YqiC
MFDSKTLDELASHLVNTVPAGLQSLKEDLEKSFHSILQATLAKLDLVTREEFEVQKGVLAKTRAKVEALERQIAEIEQRFVDSGK